MAARAHRILFALHLWTGIAAGLLLAVLCASGSALVYRDALDRAMSPGMDWASTATTTDIHADLDATLNAITRANPGWRIASIELHETDHGEDPWRVRLTPLPDSSPGQTPRTLFVNPYTGALLGERAAGQGFVAWLARLHNTLLLGETGERIEGVLGGLLLVVLGTGVWLWWPRRAALRGLRRFHGWAGAWLALPLAAQAATGMMLAFGLPAAALVVVLLGGSRAELNAVFASPRAPAVAGSAAPLQAELEAVYRLHPDAESVLLSLPGAGSDAVGVYLKRRDDERLGSFVQMRLSRHTGALLSTYDSRHTSFALRALFWLDALHFGTFGGGLTKALWVVVGFSPALLFASGSWLWWRRLRLR